MRRQPPHPGALLAHSFPGAVGDSSLSDRPCPDPILPAMPFTRAIAASVPKAVQHGWLDLCLAENALLGGSLFQVRGKGWFENDGLRSG